MLKRRILVLTLVALMLALPVVAAAASAVDFKDDNLQAAVKEEFANLGRFVEVSKIPQADMKLLKKLYAKGGYASNLDDADEFEVITNLAGLEYALNLGALDLSNNKIKDLAPIRNLSLHFLDITGNCMELNDDGTGFEEGSNAFSYNPSSAQMKILQEIQNQGAVVCHDGPVKRISGPDRYQTAIRIWQNMYTRGFDEDDGEFVMNYEGGDTIILTRGDDYVDALVGAPLAFTLGMGNGGGETPDIPIPAPILLTTPNKLHQATKAAVLDYLDKTDLKQFNIYVLGGTAAVSDAVVNELIYAIETEFEGLDIKTVRIGGADRYETAVKIAKRLDVDDDDVELIFASGENFPDALAAAPYAAMFDVPILLTKKDALPGCVVDYLKELGEDILLGEENDENLFEAVAVGGSAVISEKLLDQLKSLKYRFEGQNMPVFADDGITRAWGADRYATSVELAKHYNLINEDGAVTGDFFVATGENYADALTGAVPAAGAGSGILLVRKDTIPAAVAKAVDSDDEFNAFILGGEAAVSLHNAVSLFNLVR